jgi:hypothetical protein
MPSEPTVPGHRRAAAGGEDVTRHPGIDTRTESFGTGFFLSHEVSAQQGDKRRRSRW